MDCIERLQVLKDFQHSTELILSENYIFWSIHNNLESFHLDYVVSLSCEGNIIRLKIFENDSFIILTFESLSSPTKFINTTKKLCLPQPKFFKIYFNPISGNEASVSILHSLLIPLLDEAGHTYEIEQVTEDLPNFDKLCKNIIILGGDGTVHLLLSYFYSIDNKFMDDICVGVVPTGTRNSLAIELAGKSINKSLYHIVKCKTFHIDLLKVILDDGMLISTTAILWGIAADIPKGADDLRSLGKMRFPVAIFNKLLEKWSNYEAKLSIYTKSGLTYKSSEFTGIFLGNNKGKNWVNDEIPFPRAKINNGLVDVLIVNQCSKLWALFVFLQLGNSGNHLNNPKVELYQATKVKIESKKILNISVDGELYESQKMQIEVLPSSLKVFGSRIN